MNDYPRFDVAGLWQGPSDDDRRATHGRPSRAVPIEPPPRSTQPPEQETSDRADDPAVRLPGVRRGSVPPTGQPRRTTVHLPAPLAGWVRDQPGRSIDQVLLDAYTHHHEDVDRRLAAQLNVPDGLPVRRRRRKTDVDLVAVSLYLTDAERRLLKQPAGRVGLSMSAYATALLERAQAGPAGGQPGSGQGRP